VVRGHCLCRHRHRRAGAGGDHVYCLRHLFTRNLYKEFIRPACSQAQEANIAKIVSLVVKVGAVLFILSLAQDYAIQLQLLGGIWIIQLLPAILLGLYTRWRNASALLVGWAAGLAIGTYMAATQGFATSVYPLSVLGVSQDTRRSIRCL
jgi:solute:Na+ symporter, SSS family